MGADGHGELMLDQAPRISVAIINHNYGRFVGDAIDSALGQTRAPDQVVIVDDGSTDCSRAVLKTYDTCATVRVVLTENRGQAAATNRVVSECRGDVVCFLDSDDLMLSDKLARLAEIYTHHPEVDWVFHRLGHIDRQTGARQPSPALVRFTTGRHDHRQAVRHGSLPITLPATSALSFRAAFLGRLVPMPEGLESQDNYLKFASLGLTTGWILDEELGLQGLHDRNVYTTASGRTRDCSPHAAP